MKTIAFVHHKGGTGKTTACLNIAGCLVKQHKKVLVVDLDPQGNATSGLGLSRELESSVYQVLVGEEAIQHCIFETESGISLLPSSIDLMVFDNSLTIRQVQRLKNHLAQIANHFDVILIDTAAGHTSLMVNAIIAADGQIIIPMDMGIFAYESLESFNMFLTELSDTYHTPIQLRAVLLREALSRPSQPSSNNPLKIITKLFKKSKENGPISEYSPERDITAFFAQNGIEKFKFYRLPFADEVNQAQIKGLPISHYAPNSDIAKVYQQITTEL